MKKNNKITIVLEKKIIQSQKSKKKKSFADVCRYDCGTAMAKPKENIGLAGISNLGGVTELKPGLLLL